LPPGLAVFDLAVEKAVTWAARLAGLMLLAVGLFVFYEVVCRYVFDSPTLWVMDYSIYLVMWAVFLGAAYTMRTHGHVLVDVLVAKLSPPLRRGFALGVHVLVLAFSLCLLAAGVRSNIIAYQMNELTLSALYIPLWYPMSSIPIGFALVALEEIAALAKLLRVPGQGESEEIA
jgi:TRAP-type C4-dicarboxylate transport system permease small subunit